MFSLQALLKRVVMMLLTELYVGLLVKTCTKTIFTVNQTKEMVHTKTDKCRWRFFLC